MAKAEAIKIKSNLNSRHSCQEGQTMEIMGKVAMREEAKAK
jgi:hypothetical protein